MCLIIVNVENNLWYRQQFSKLISKNGYLEKPGKTNFVYVMKQFNSLDSNGNSMN